jgi:hypothetical protein
MDDNLRMESASRRKGYKHSGNEGDEENSIKE